MATKEELLAEAYRRGLLTGEKKAAYEEAARRGLVPTAKPAKGGGVLSAISGMAAHIDRGTGVLDELGAAMSPNVLLALGRTVVAPQRSKGVLATEFNKSMGNQRDIEDRFQETNPTTANLSRGTGTAATMLIPGGAAMQGGRGINMARGAVAGATEAAAYGLADRGTAQERLDAGNKGAVLGGVLGGIGGAVTPATKTAKPPKPAKPQPVPLDKLHVEKTKAYEAVDNAQVQFTDTAFDDLITGISDELKAAKINPKLHPKAYELMRGLEDSRGTMPTLTQLDQLRQYIRLNTKGADDAEKMFAEKMVANIDEFIDAAGPGQLASRGGVDPGPIMREARAANTRYRKVQSVEDAVEKAKLRAGSANSGGNIDNTTRQELRRVLEKTRNLTPEERATMTDIVMGGKAQNVLRNVGKVSPTNGGMMGLLGSILPVALPGIGGAFPAAGFVSKTIADRITQQKVQGLLGLMANGGKPALQAEEDLASLAAKNPQVAKLYADIVARVRRSAVASAQTNQPAQNVLATSPR